MDVTLALRSLPEMETKASPCYTATYLAVIYLLMLGKQNPSKYWTEYIPSVHYSLGLVPTSAKRRKEKGGMKTKELRDGGGEAN